MSGFKGEGLLKQGNVSHSELPGIHSKINFAVPSKDILRNHVQKHDCGCTRPGILKSISIKLMASTNINISQSYRIIFDGKKIASGYGAKLGDVDVLFGHEVHHTLTEMQTQLEITERSSNSSI